ncbi:arylsulfatase B-like [Oppia nitens]|uniref:arylsulfatase B-like n=1 Tax=Oppia nitens TaxID=1686743 RepID=UPI0023D9B799|nr:arylsulfatase B-like [Oppia nitens]
MQFLLILLSLISSIVNCQLKRPNIIVIVADDYGWGDIGFHGSQQVRTPNLDLLASSGIILNNYYVSPICSPSRSALLTGYHPIHTGLQHDVLNGGQPYGLPLQYKTLPQYLKSLGYQTHGVGKWHQGFFQRSYIPTERGFDTHFGYWTGHEDYYDRTSQENWWGIDFRDNDKLANLTEYEGQYSTDIYTDKSVDIILRQTENTSQPLFLYIAHQSVHAGNGREPLQAPEQYIDRFKHIKDQRRRTFVAMVSALDDSMGKVFAALQKADILDNTIIIFTADNGGATGGADGKSIDNSIGSNWPLRGAKYTLWEGGIRGNAFIWSPLLNKHYISDHLMHIQDWLPTIYSAIGGNVQDLGPIDGIDMWNVLNNNLKSPRKHVLHNIDPLWNVWALRYNNYKLISGSVFNGDFDGWFLPPGESIHLSLNNSIAHQTCEVYKTLKQINYNFNELIKQVVVNCNKSLKSECHPTVKPCLFDIQSDPCEYNNIYDRKPDIVDHMLVVLSTYNASAVAPGNKPVNWRANPALHNYVWDIWM